MATAKQLANLAKARAAKSAKKSSKKSAKKSFKEPTKKSVKKPTKKSVFYIVSVKAIGGKIGYLTVSGALDTDKKLAVACTKIGAEKAATDIFNKHKKQLIYVKVLRSKK